MALVSFLVGLLLSCCRFGVGVSVDGSVVEWLVSWLVVMSIGSFSLLVVI